MTSPIPIPSEPSLQSPDRVAASTDSGVNAEPSPDAGRNKVVTAVIVLGALVALAAVAVPVMWVASGIQDSRAWQPIDERVESLGLVLLAEVESRLEIDDASIREQSHTGGSDGNFPGLMLDVSSGSGRRASQYLSYITVYSPEGADRLASAVRDVAERDGFVVTSTTVNDERDAVTLTHEEDPRFQVTITIRPTKVFGEPETTRDVSIIVRGSKALQG